MMIGSPRRLIDALPAGLLLALALCTGGCATHDKQHGPDQINHVVLFVLERPEDAAELQDDCERLLKPMPEVSYYACGTHVDVGRSTVDGDYTLGLIVSFDDRRDYEAYLVDPAHVSLVEKWKPRFTGLTIYDIGNSKVD
ncbi:MAG: Dabb family protein [Planctomycetota bacterium]|nr:Dabb family protein [Planctomycetota bacterium]